MKKRTLKVFVDFDGTITLEDVGEAIFRKFGCTEKTSKIIDDLLCDKISSRQCWDELCNSVEYANRKELEDFIDSLDVDPTFVPFVKFCGDNEIELIVLSDGFDFYIKRLFSKADLVGLKYYSNKLYVTENGKLYAEYPHYDSDSPSSANCKKNHIMPRKKK